MSTVSEQQQTMFPDVTTCNIYKSQLYNRYISHSSEQVHHGITIQISPSSQEYYIANDMEASLYAISAFKKISTLPICTRGNNNFHFDTAQFIAVPVNFLFCRQRQFIIILTFTSLQVYFQIQKQVITRLALCTAHRAAMSH